MSAEPTFDVVVDGIRVAAWANWSPDDSLSWVIEVDGVPVWYASARVEGIDLPEAQLVALDRAIARAIAAYEDRERARGAPLVALLEIESWSWAARQAAEMAVSA